MPQQPSPGQARDDARSIIRAIVDAYNRKDIGAFEEMYHADIRYWSALDDWQRGRPKVLAHLRHLFDTLPDEQMEPDVVVTDGTTAVVEFTSTGSRSDGTPYRIEFTEVFELDADGTITSAMAYLDPEVVADIA